jgi:hypothetical protein
MILTILGVWLTLNILYVLLMFKRGSLKENRQEWEKDDWEIRLQAVKQWCDHEREIHQTTTSPDPPGRGLYRRDIDAERLPATRTG